MQSRMSRNVDLSGNSKNISQRAMALPECDNPHVAQTELNIGSHSVYLGKFQDSFLLVPKI